jgi:hypothetical protein
MSLSFKQGPDHRLPRVPRTANFATWHFLSQLNDHRGSALLRIGEDSLFQLAANLFSTWETAINPKLAVRWVADPNPPQLSPDIPPDSVLF